jgi:hypothetical protein
MWLRYTIEDGEVLDHASLVWGVYFAMKKNSSQIPSVLHRLNYKWKENPHNLYIQNSLMHKKTPPSSDAPIAIEAQVHIRRTAYRELHLKSTRLHGEIKQVGRFEVEHSK